jgi:penicillin amidase
MPGRIPIRQEGHTGLLPVPGWTGAHEWQGYIPFDDLPSAFNPAQGYIVTANNAVVGSSYPYLITHQWDYGYRAQRLAELIEQGKGQLSMDTMRAMQADSKDLLAEELIPILLDAIRDDPDLTEVREMLADWDCHFRPDSAPALLYSAFWRSLVEEVYADDLPEGHQVGVDSRAMELIRGLLSDPEDFWWDDQSTENREDRDEILRRALARALDEVENRQGREAANWGWGKEHTVTFENQVMSSFPFINQAFNRGPYPAGGGNSLVNAAGWSAEEPYVVDWLPSLRMIVDLGDLAKSRAAHTTGQSGHAYHPHYVDMVPLWQNIQHYGMLWTREEVQNQAEAHLQLLPAP